MVPVKKKPLLVSIVGPTAVGKTALSIALANHFNTVILSADSRQMYKHISIGTAKPSLEEQAGIKHYFLDFLELEEVYSAGQFEKDALKLIEGELKDLPVIILCGGSGLYVKALLEGLDDVPKSEFIREELNSRFAKEGLEPLLNELQSLDPVSSERIDKNNPQRVIRALEVCLASGRPFSSFHKTQAKERPFDSMLIGLKREREELKERIAKRCHAMMKEGWIAEAKNVYEKRGLNSLNTVGYKELFKLLDDAMSQEECIDAIIVSTQRFAKRQMTWFNKINEIQWMALPDEDIQNELIQRIKSRIHS